MGAKQRIMHVIDHTASGGTQKQLQIRLLDLREKYDFSVAVLRRTGGYSQEYRALGIPVYELGAETQKWNPGVFLPLLRLVHREKPDILHAHLFKSMILAPLVARCTGTACILHDHSGVNQQSLRFYFSNPFKRNMVSIALHLAILLSDHMVVFTESAKQDYLREFKVENRKITILPNSIDLDSSDSRMKKIDLCQELNLPGNTRLIIMVGRLSPEKDWLTFLEVAARFPDPAQFAFIVVGSGDQENQLREMVSREDLKNVHFMGERQDVPSLLADADAFLLTSRQEAFGNVILEAMAAGCPVIASSTPGAISIIRHAQSGLLVEIGDVDGFADGLDKIMNDLQMRNKLVANARLSLPQYSSSHVSAKLEEVYENLIRDGSARSR